jgi:uroporphyrin-III C-methyltransferase
MQFETNRFTGKVYITGAGPGDPELITLKGKRVLEEADVIIYDRLVNPELLAFSHEDSEHIYVGKQPGKPSVSQNRINRILVSKAKEGKTVVRLKGGDPFIFGRGSEESEALVAEQIPFEIIPGISSALAAPAYAGIPLTHRTLARSFTVVTGHTLNNSDTFLNWDHLSHADTLVILMGMKNLPKIVETLIKQGRSPETPVAIIEKATLSEQRTITATLRSIAEKSAGFSSPAVIVVGELASMSQDLEWFTPEDQNQNYNYTGKLTKFAV